MTELSYRNPVYEGYFADPFVLRHAGVYYAIGTGGAEAAGESGDRVFPMLRSSDFVTWEPLGPVLVRAHESLGDTYWAPEIALSEGIFYLYYSVGFGDRLHQLRVATSESVTGPYHDSGVALTDLERCSFAIDPHPFRDVDGRWYLFHARDFLDELDEEGHAVRIGTALVVHPLTSMTHLSEQGRTVLRASEDWQRFEANRSVYGGTYDWHTLEGPSVFFHAGKYYCFYSGGRWENESYGVDYAVADHVLGPYRVEPSESPRVLRTAPGHALGPGHNSIAIAPTGTPYVVYHAWDPSFRARRMCIDPLDFTPEGPRCAGPTWTTRALR